METPVTLSQLGLYNPRRQSGELTEKLFVIRQKQFEMLMEAINSEEDNSIPQHHIIIAQRGMGKTTMLHRIAIELRKDKYNDRFIPLAFPEEQYDITNLGDFWLNCLDALADALENKSFEGKYKTEVECIDKQIKELALHRNSEETSARACRILMETCKTIAKRPVLLVDNIGILLYKLDRQNQHCLRALLSENGAPVLMGAGVAILPSQVGPRYNTVTPVTDYEAPFYDYFQIHYMKKLSFEEFLDLLVNLSNVTQSDISIIDEKTPRLKTLHQLTGGNPRTAVMLFKLIVKGFSEEVNDDLEALLDEITPLYKARYEELSEQSQTIVASIALNWDAMSLKHLSQQSGYANNQLSPQLKRLIEEGWIETTPAEKAKGNAYSISERFFNIWFLMRMSTRRNLKGVNLLTKYLESFHGSDLERVAKKHLGKDYQCEKDFEVGFALRNSKMLDTKIRKQFEHKIASSPNIECIKNKDLENEVSKLKDKQDRKENDVYAICNKGNMYYNKGNYDKAIECYEQAIKLNPDDAKAYNNLQESYRDKLRRISKANISEAKELFNQIKDKLEPDERSLYETLFELHNRNEGIATTYFSEALQTIQDELPKTTMESWFCFAATCLHLNYGQWLLDILSETGFDKILSPYFVAVQALEIERKENQEKAEIYLRNRAIEKSEPARMIIEIIKGY